MGTGQEKVASRDLPASRGKSLGPPSGECCQNRQPRQRAFEMGFAAQIGVHKVERVLWAVGSGRRAPESCG